MEELKNTIYELETSLLKPEVRSSLDQLNLLIADDFKEFGSSGFVYHKVDTLERLPASLDKIEFVISDFQAQALSENFILTTFKIEKVVNGAEKIVSLRSSIWKKTDGSWQMFFHQGTLIK